MYLLDTNIIIFYFRGKYNLDRKIDKIGIENCFVSEITVAELRFGAAKSSNPQKNREIVDEFEKNISVIPIYAAFDKYAEEKARLELQGQKLDDFDLLIGCTAICKNMILVTNNVKHFTRLNNIQIEDWTK